MTELNSNVLDYKETQGLWRDPCRSPDSKLVIPSVQIRDVIEPPKGGQMDS